MRTSRWFAIAGTIFLALAITGVMFVVSDVLFGCLHE